MLDSTHVSSVDVPDSKHHFWVLLSPLVVILLGQLTARTLGPMLGIWSWIPLNVGYWSIILLFVAWGGGREAFTRWLGPSHGSWYWGLVAIGIAVVPTVPMLFPDTWRLFLQIKIWLPTIFFVLINPFAEEFYWRGLLLDHAGIKSRWLAVFYACTLFTINHMWIAIIAIGARSPMATLYQFIFALIMSMTYLKMQSLRWPIAAHFLANLLTPIVAVFLNLYIPAVP